MDVLTSNGRVGPRVLGCVVNLWNTEANMGTDQTIDSRVFVIVRAYNEATVIRDVVR